MKRTLILFIFSCFVFLFPLTCYAATVEGMFYVTQKSGGVPNTYTFTNFKSTSDEPFNYNTAFFFIADGGGYIPWQSYYSVPYAAKLIAAQPFTCDRVRTWGFESQTYNLKSSYDSVRGFHYINITISQSYLTVDPLVSYRCSQYFVVSDFKPDLQAYLYNSAEFNQKCLDFFVLPPPTGVEVGLRAIGGILLTFLGSGIGLVILLLALLILVTFLSKILHRSVGL